jgi:type I restriction enzyme, S subunit
VNGTDLIGPVPAHWTVKPLRLVGRLFKGTGGSKEDVVEKGVPCVRYGDLYTTHNNFIEQARTYLTEERAQGYTPIEYGDVLFAASGETIEEIGKSAVNLLHGARCGGDVVILRPVAPTHARFLGYATDASPVAAQKSLAGRGTTVKHIYPDELREVVIAVPPLREQQMIADFLDRETARVDALVTAKQRLLDLLAEKRKAIVATAVTRGLDREARMVRTGVEWMPKAPSHWRPSRIGRLFRQSKLLGFPDLTVLSVYREYGVIERSSRDDNANVLPDDLTKYQLVEAGDLVVNKMKAWQGSLGISDLRGITSPDYVVFRPTHPELPAYLHFMLRTPQLTTVYLSNSNGIRINQWRIEPERFLNIPVLLPPMDEQRAIVEHIARETEKLDAVRGATERTMALLKERRAALIAAAVTGQIDVGTAA